MAMYVAPEWLYVDTGTATSSTAWGYWTTGTAAGATTTTIGNPWPYWTAATTVGTTTGGYVRLAPQPTPEQLAAAEDARRIARAAWEERQARERADREQAVQRAETLLHSQLDSRQRAMLRTQRRFHVRSQHGRRYEIERGHHGNVYALDDQDRRIEKLCVYATGGVPEGDCMLAQKLHIEGNEEAFRRVAHITPLAPIQGWLETTVA